MREIYVPDVEVVLFSKLPLDIQKKIYYEYYLPKYLEDNYSYLKFRHYQRFRSVMMNIFSDSYSTSISISDRKEISSIIRKEDKISRNPNIMRKSRSRVHKNKKLLSQDIEDC